MRLLSESEISVSPLGNRLANAAPLTRRQREGLHDRSRRGYLDDAVVALIGDEDVAVLKQFGAVGVVQLVRAVPRPRPSCRTATRSCR